MSLFTDYSYILRQIYASCISNFMFFSFGINFGFTTNVIYQLEKSNTIVTEKDSAEIGASGFLLSSVGCLLSGYLLDKIGRKYTLLLIYGLQTVGWAIVCTTSYLLIGRYVTSLAVGMGYLCLVYTAEITEPKYRGVISLSSSFYELIGTFGVNFALYYISWQVISIWFAIISAFFFFNTFFIPESPYWYILQNQTEKSKEILTRLRKADSNIDAEIQEITQTLLPTATSSETLVNTICNLRNCKLLALYGIYILLCELNGYDLITPYSVQFFDLFNRTSFDSRVLTMGFSVISFIGTVLLMFFVEKFDRKVILNLSNAANVIFFGVAAVQQTFFSSEYSFVAVTCIMGFASLVQLSVVLLPFIVIAEALPNESRGVLYSILGAELFVLIYVAARLFPMIMASIAVKYILGAFCVVSTLNIIYVNLFIPETRGKILGEMTPLIES